MLIDLSTTTGLIYFQGTKLSGTYAYMKLYSKYNNKYILNNANISGVNPYFPLTTGPSNPNWYGLSWAYDNLDLQAEDVGGYYNLEIYNSADEIILPIQLAKVTNGFEFRGQPTDTISFPSSNETNEQYTFFR
jgi:hypothetical protein